MSFATTPVGYAGAGELVVTTETVPLDAKTGRATYEEPIPIRRGSPT